MTAPTIYRYDDAGTPVLGGRQDGFYQILRACLVDGYGSKSAAGWSVVYDDWANSGYCTFTNANETAVLGIVRAAGNYQPFLFIAEAMIDATTFVNARSGWANITAPWAPSDTDAAYQRPAIQAATIESWCVVATANTAFVFSARDEFDLTTLDVDYSESRGWFLGLGVFDDARGLAASDPGNFAIIGGALGNWADVNESTNAYNQIGIGTCLIDINNAAFSGVGATMLAPCIIGSNILQPYITANAVGKISLSPCDIYVSQNTSGNFRYYAWQRAVVPMLMSHVFLCGNGSSQGSVLPIISNYASRVLLDILAIGGKNYLLCRAPRNAYFFISIDASDWS